MTPYYEHAGKVWYNRNHDMRLRLRYRGFRQEKMGIGA